MHIFLHSKCARRSVATYKGTEATSPLIHWFWAVMEEFSTAERSLFLRWAAESLCLCDYLRDCMYEVLFCLRVCLYSIALPSLREIIGLQVTICLHATIDLRAMSIWVQTWICLQSLICVQLRSVCNY